MYRVAALLVGAAVVCAPIPVGGYEAWLLPVALALAGGALVWVLGGRGDGDFSWLVFWGFVAGYGALLAFWIHAARDLSFYWPGADVVGLGVLDVGRAVEFFSRLALYGALAFAVSRFGRREADMVLLAVVLSAVFQSLYGIIAYSLGNPPILGIWQEGMHTTSMMGTFYSRNNFAGYLALALPLGLAWLWRQHVGAAPRSARRGLFLGLAVLYAMLLAVALIGSASRFGVAAAVLGLAVWAMLSMRGLADDVSPLARRLFTGAAVAFGLFAILWFGLDVIGERLLQLSFADARFDIWATMLRMPMEAWIWGIGPGQFVDVFKLFQDAALPQVYWRALNDPLQFVLEYGIVGATLCAVLLAWWLRRNWPRRLDGLRAAALAGMIAMLAHSLGDFDLRVIGTASLFWVAVGILLRREGGAGRA